MDKEKGAKFLHLRQKLEGRGGFLWLVLDDVTAMLQLRATSRLLHLKFYLVRRCKKETEPRQLRHGKGSG